MDQRLAAIRFDDGAIYVARTHIEALEEARRANPALSDADFDAVAFEGLGFVKPDGVFRAIEAVAAIAYRRERWQARRAMRAMREAAKVL